MRTTILTTATVLIFAAGQAWANCGNCAGDAKGDKCAEKPACKAGGAACDKDGGKTCEKPCDKACDKGADCSKCEGKSPDCKFACEASVAGGMPRIAYLVDDHKTMCPAEADKLAAEHKMKIKYEVDGKAYEEKPEALKAYAETLESHLRDMGKVWYVVGEEKTCCPHSAEQMAKKADRPISYQVAGVTFKDEASAVAAAKEARMAAAKVKLAYAVGDKSYECDKTAAESCKQGEKVEYAVAGRRTECAITAQVYLAQDKIRTFAKTLAASTEDASGDDKKAETESDKVVKAG